MASGVIGSPQDLSAFDDRTLWVQGDQGPLKHTLAQYADRRNSQDLWIGVSRDLLITTV